MLKSFIVKCSVAPSIVKLANMAAEEQNKILQSKPLPRSGHVAACAGNVMFVWGGYFDRVSLEYIRHAQILESSVEIMM